MSLNAEPVDRILFVDRDGTIIEEPEDFQIDSVEKFALVPMVIPSLLRLKEAGYRFVMVSNQDGLGSPAYPEEKFAQIQKLLMQILESQGIVFEKILICPHSPQENCECRKPSTALLRDYLKQSNWNRSKSAVIGDRNSDMVLAERLGVQGIFYSKNLKWPAITQRLLSGGREARISRKTLETEIEVVLNLNQPTPPQIHTGLPFFDHMLAQLGVHSGSTLQIQCRGDLEVEAHHSIEDVALALGEAWRQALGSRKDIERFAFALPMDECRAQAELDLGGRAYFVWSGKFNRPEIQGFPTEMTEHFFRSFATAIEGNLNLRVDGDNAHHMVEACFKTMGRLLGQASRTRAGGILTSSKGSL